MKYIMLAMLAVGLSGCGWLDRTGRPVPCGD